MSRNVSNPTDDTEREQCEWMQLRPTVRLGVKVEMATTAFEVDFNRECVYHPEGSGSKS